MGGYGALWQRLPAAPPYCPKAVKADFDRIHDPKTQSPRRMAVIDSVNVLGLYRSKYCSIGHTPPSSERFGAPRSPSSRRRR